MASVRLRRRHDWLGNYNLSTATGGLSAEPGPRFDAGGLKSWIGRYELAR